MVLLCDMLGHMMPYVWHCFGFTCLIYSPISPLIIWHCDLNAGTDRFITTSKIQYVIFQQFASDISFKFVATASTKRRKKNQNKNKNTLSANSPLFLFHTLKACNFKQQWNYINTCISSRCLMWLKKLKRSSIQETKKFCIKYLC